MFTFISVVNCNVCSIFTEATYIIAVGPGFHSCLTLLQWLSLKLNTSVKYLKDMFKMCFFFSKFVFDHKKKTLGPSDFNRIFEKKNLRMKY